MNINKLNKSTEAVQILRNINKNYASNSLIAGGYYRDIYHNLPFNDIDIFVNVDQAMSKNIASDMFTKDIWAEIFDLNLESLFSDDYIDIMGDDSEYDNSNDIASVFEISKNNISYNVVLVEMLPKEYVENVFDFGICKAYCDGTKITFTEDFISDANNKNITFTNLGADEESFSRSMHVHLRKLMTKFPSHQVMVPPQYQKYLRLLQPDLIPKIKIC